MYTFYYCVVNDEVPSTSFQIGEQNEVIQKAVLPEMSKLDDSALGKKQGGQTQFSAKKCSGKNA